MDELINVKLSKKESTKQNAPVAMSEDTPQYPYGLEIRLDKDTLKKLGISIDDFSIEDGVMIHAQGFVKSLSKSSCENSDNEDMSIQLTDIALNSFSEDEYEDEEDLGWDDEGEKTEAKLKRRGY